MGLSRQLDPARPAAGGYSLIRCALPLVLFLLLPGTLRPQTPSSASNAVSPETVAKAPQAVDSYASRARELFDQQRWEELVQLLEARKYSSSSDRNYYYGVALAQLGRLDEA